MGTIKLSTLFLYLRIFATGAKFRYIIYAALALVGGALLSAELSLIFGCRPVKAFFVWNVHGECINLNAHQRAVSIINIFTDFLIVVIPVPVIWSLHLRLKQKLMVLAILSTGLL
jgi:hypothetical protein